MKDTNLDCQHDLIVVQNSIKTVKIFRSDYINKYLSQGGQVIIIAPNDCSDSRDYLLSIGAKVPIKYNGNNFAIRAIIMNYYIVKLSLTLDRPIFVCHFIVTYLMTFLSFLLFSSKVHLSIEGLGSFFLKKPQALFFLRKIIGNKKVTRFFCNHNERELVGKGSDIILGGIGVDLDYFSPVDKPTNHEYYNLIYMGRLIEDKGISEVISTFRALCQDRDDLRLYIVGDVYPSNPTSLTVEDIDEFKNEFGEKIIFTGYTTDPKYWYSISDILLLPSKREGFPVCVMEANAMGIPCICFDVPGCSEAIVDGVNGFLVDLNDLSGLYSSVINILSHDKLNYLKIKSRSYAVENFDVNNKSFKFLELIIRKDE